MLQAVTPHHMPASVASLVNQCCQTLQVSIMAAIRHPNVVMFMGLCLAPVCIVIEFCPRGSLSDVIQRAASDGVFAQQLPWPKRLSMALDAAKVRSHLAHLASSQ